MSFAPKKPQELVVEATPPMPRTVIQMPVLEDELQLEREILHPRLYRPQKILAVDKARERMEKLNLQMKNLLTSQD
jgi:hypothetical protein